MDFFKTNRFFFFLDLAILFFNKPLYSITVSNTFVIFSNVSQLNRFIIINNYKKIWPGNVVVKKVEDHLILNSS